MGRTEEAIEALEKALELNPDIVQAWNNLANAYLQKGDVDKAVETNLRLLNLAPDFGLGRNNLAVAYFHKGEFDKAIEQADKAKELGFEVHPDFLKELEPHRQS
jgi:tetratricopeptide (TPR) repeat protein